ncbi:MAG TPA: hypothetical protein VFQ35_19645, partial [Polyangiaceae bacterium]|nr:hypothetical protein [Polyangiaceae bacterium]
VGGSGAGGAESVPARTREGDANGGVGGVGGEGGDGGRVQGPSAGANEPVSCASLAEAKKVLYVTGSSAARPFLELIARQLTLQGVYLVYSATGSCVGVDAALNGTALSATATYWDSVVSTGATCRLSANGVTTDVAVSDVFAETCPGFELANLSALGVADAHGPIQTMAFVVPASSPQRVISSQAAYFVYGFGQAGGVLDLDGVRRVWSDEGLVFQRNASSGTQALLAAAIGVPAERFRGQSVKSSDDMAASIQAAGIDPERAANTIGLLAADFIESRDLRASVRVLAYQDSRQFCGFYPDSTATARDKQNVRDGHYALWGPLHLLYKVDSLGNPRNPENRELVLAMVGYLSGSKPLPNGVRLIDVYAQSGLVPECAMRVQRTKDGGNVTPFRPNNPCGCLFEVSATGATACKPCTVQGDCSDGETCSLGYCEP